MTSLSFRRATVADVPVIVGLLADDIIGMSRESSSDVTPQAYFDAFAEIVADSNQYLCVAEQDGCIVGTLQLSFIPGLSRGGATRGQIEAVRVVAHRRGEQLGKRLFEWALQMCRSRGCSLVQLTTDRARPDAHRFYESLGFEASHVGYKMKL